MSLTNSFRDNFTKKNQHCLELLYDDDRVLYLACYDNEQVKQWLSYIKRAMHFSDWFNNLKLFLSNEKDNLTEKISLKLSEIIQFFE